MKTPLIPGLILAAGGVVVREGSVLLVHRTQHNDWSLPKGKLDPGETPLAAAVREVREETGYEVTAGPLAGSIAYVVNDTPKVVLYWLMTPKGRPRPVQDPSEINGLRWVAAEEALRLLTYPLERDLLERLLKRQSIA